MWLNLLFGSVAALFAFMSGHALVHLRWVRRLPAATPLPNPLGAGADVIRCSVVVPARDEADRIEGAVGHLLDQQGVAIDVVVVDDRSTDRTSEIVAALAASDPRVTLRRIDALPPGWLGKCYACHLGATAATGEWILFSDADCWLKPDVIARALMVADAEAADHITLTPGVTAPTIGARAWHLTFLMSAANWISGVNNDRPKAYLGVGAFNLVRASAYRESGGYERLRLTVIDDVKLGLLLRRAGKRTRAFIGGDDAECHWGTTLPAMVKIMEKNYFAVVDFRTEAAVTLGVIGPLVWLTAVVGPFTGTAAGIAAGVALLSSIIPAHLLAQRLGWRSASAFLVPLIYPVMFYAMLNSALVTLRQGGIRWRDTFYPLKDLREHGVR